MAFIDRPSMVNTELSIEDISVILSIAKVIKSNLIVYNKHYKRLIGFSTSFFDANVLKVFNPKDSSIFNFISNDVPNMAVYTKDLAALIKKSEEYQSPIQILTTNYIRNDNDVMCDIWCGKDHKVCFDYFKYAKKYARIIKTESDRLIKHYDNIKKIPEFNEAFSHSSSDGIQRFKYDGFVYFVLPTLINALKSEPVSLDVYLDINHLSNNPEDAKSALLMFTIHKKIGDVVVYYRTRIL